MSKVAPGKYYIVNRVISLTGRPLALHYDGKNAVVTVVTLQDMPTQVWIIKDYSDGKTQSMSPQNAPHLQIGMGDGVIKVLEPHNYVWTIRESDGVCTVQDGGCTVFMGLEKAINKEPVCIGQETEGEKQNWLLIPA